MSLGVTLTQDDLKAIRRLFEQRWSAEIKNWKERGTDYCMWFVTCPDKKNIIITVTGQNLATTIDKALRKALD